MRLLLRVDTEAFLAVDLSHGTLRHIAGGDLAAANVCSHELGLLSELDGVVVEVVNAIWLVDHSVGGEGSLSLC